MNLRQLEIFISIVEEGSLTKAADRVHIVQPALTQQIKVLEEEFGVPLLLRSSRGVRPTEAGTRLVTHARALLAQFAALRGQVLGTGMEPAGDVRVGVPASASALVSPGLISAIATMYPAVRVHIVEPMMGVVTDWLDEARLDFALSYRSAHPSGIGVEKVLTESIFLCCPLNSPEAQGGDAGGEMPFAQACMLPLIVPHRGYSIREMLEGHARQQNCKLNVSIEIESAGPTRALVEQGLGYAFLPALATANEHGQRRFVTRAVAAPQLERSLYLASSQERPLTSTATLVREVCREVLADLVREGVWDARLEGGDWPPSPKDL